MAMSEIFMTIGDVAKQLGLPEERLLAMAESGNLPATRTGEQWRIRRVDFEKWVAGHATTSPVSGQRFVIVNSFVASTKKLGNKALDELTERVPQAELHHRLVRALGPSIVLTHSAAGTKPFELDLMAPLPQKVRVYMYNVTRPPGGRPLGEHKVQLIVPGQRRGDRASFDNSDGRIAILIGYAAEEDVFVLWDAGLYSDFAWSRNVQVKSETIIAATAGQLATQERQLRPSNGLVAVETVLAVKPRLLRDALLRRMQLTRERLLRD